jgi:hypothetical protein
MINAIGDIVYSNDFFSNVWYNIIFFTKGVCLRVIEYINKSVSLCASKY